jgi:hypothetical protein
MLSTVFIEGTAGKKERMFFPKSQGGNLESLTISSATPLISNQMLLFFFFEITFLFSSIFSIS